MILASTLPPPPSKIKEWESLPGIMSVFDHPFHGEYIDTITHSHGLWVCIQILLDFNFLSTILVGSSLQIETSEVFWLFEVRPLVGKIPDYWTKFTFYITLWWRTYLGSPIVDPGDRLSINFKRTVWWIELQLLRCGSSNRI